MVVTLVAGEKIISWMDSKATSRDSLVRLQVMFVYVLYLHAGTFFIPLALGDLYHAFYKTRRR